VTADDAVVWLFGIARRIAANSRRRSGRRRTEPVARALGMSQVAVRVARHRALRRLRAEARTTLLAATTV
jgi:RNA polymerase sigma-70 factor (ECF subfamily)